ncbi:MAG: ABC transporter ATP-binding protein [Acidobacteria bacterium]|nr:MAG: ABC transporter ATP-binding protein [Acidobacteriota bacterium]
MKKYLQKKYALTDAGADDVAKSIISSTLVNLSVMLPIMLSFVFLRQYIDRFLENQAITHLELTHFLGLIVAIFIVMYFIAKNDYHKSFVKIYDESARSRIKLAEKLKKLPLSYFGKKDIADLSATIMSDETTFEHLFSHSVPKVYAGIASILVIAVMLFFFDYRLAASLFWVVPISYLVFKLSKNKIRRLFKEAFDLNREIIDNFQEGINLVQEIKAYNREEFFVSAINKKYDRDLAHKKKIELIPGSVLNLSISILKLGMATVAIYGASLLLAGRVDVFTYLAFIVISGIVFNPIVTAMMNFAEMMYLDSIVERIREIKNMPSQEGSTELKPDGYDIVFEHVHFSYEEGLSVLKDVSFTARQGEVTALVGPSGGGKTTAAKLAARFWDIAGGRITLGGVDISQIDPETLLKEFSIVFQDVSLFNESVMENIRLGRKGATDDEVKKVAEIARCDEFIKKLPDGYHTLIGENGEKLSGGERQRLSIARALLKDAPIILLDEATASLDAENESKIQAGISELIKNKTVIIIAHRMRTVVDADNIVVLKDGRIVESGKSKDLIARGGLFANMYKAQYQ